MYKCDCCKEEFIRDEVVFLLGDDIVSLQEECGSGDIDNTLCKFCYDKHLEDLQMMYEA